MAEVRVQPLKNVLFQFYTLTGQHRDFPLVIYFSNWHSCCRQSDLLLRKAYCNTCRLSVKLCVGNVECQSYPVCYYSLPTLYIKSASVSRREICYLMFKFLLRDVNAYFWCWPEREKKETFLSV